MDPFEEFEFKPLTDGLGFHNRATEKTSTKDRAQKFDLNLEMMAPDTASETAPTTQIQTTLPRKETKSNLRQEPVSPVANTVDEILKTLGERRKYDFEDKTIAHNNYQARTNTQIFTASRFEFSAALLDGMLIIASYLAAMIILLVVTKVDLFGNLLNADEDGMIYIGLFGMFAMITWIYLVANRMFLGFTPGEWVFDQRLGRPEQLGTAEYSMKVALRSLVILLTGFALIPLTSMISRRDWLGRMMGVELIKKV